MSLKRILSIAAFLLGEAIIVAGFYLLGGGMPDGEFRLNLIVSTIIYCALFVDVLVPWISSRDKSQKSVGSIGVRWIVTWIYAICAIAIMLIARYAVEIPFKTQVIIHSALLLMLLLGFIAVLHSSDKVSETYSQEARCRRGLDEMKKAAAALKDAALTSGGVPSGCMAAITELEESLRYISPSNAPEAYTLEVQFAEVVKRITYAVSDYPLNKEKIESDLKRAGQIYQSLKSIYSN